MVRSGPLDNELALTLRDGVPALTDLNQKLTALDAYIASAKSIWHFFAFGKRKRAGQILSPHGLQLAPETAQRVRDFLAGVRSRLLVQALGDDLTESSTGSGLRSDEQLLSVVEQHEAVLDALARVHGESALQVVRAGVLDALAGRQPLDAVLDGLRRSRPRA